MMLRHRGLSVDDQQIVEWMEEKLKKAPSERSLSPNVTRHKSRSFNRRTRIMRSLAKRLGLAGVESGEECRAREFLKFAFDYVRITSNYFAIKAGLKADEYSDAYEIFLGPVAHEYLPIFQCSLRNSGFLLSSGPSYVDFVVAHQLHLLDTVDRTILAKYPRLADYKRRVYALAKRPIAQMGTESEVANEPMES